MKKIFTKAFAFLLCTVMLVTCAPLDGFVLETEAASFKVGDIIEFGMYPQARVEASYFNAAYVNELANEAGRFEYMGNEYLNAGNGVYFLVEPIEWRVLSVGKDGILVISEKILDARKFHNTPPYPTWANSTIRAWLNSDFYNIAFSSSEKAKIATSLIGTADHCGFDGGVDTYDKVFLLSLYYLLVMFRILLMVLYHLPIQV